MNFRQFSILFSLLLILGISTPIFAQDKYDVLEDLFGEAHKNYDFTDLYILVEGLKENAKLAGLTTNQIQTDAEIRLQKAELKINKNAKQYIYINVNSINIDNYSMAYSIRVSLEQNAILSRDKSIVATATTWDEGSIGVISNSNIRHIRDVISDFIDEFINKYLKYQNQIKEKKNLNSSKNKSTTPTKKTTIQPPPQTKSESDSPFTATYVGGNSPPEIQIINDSDRTLYIDIGQGKMTAYVIPSKQSKTIQIADGIYNYKASAARVSPLQGDKNFQKGYRYAWRFTIITVRK